MYAASYFGLIACLGVLVYSIAFYHGKRYWAYRKAIAEQDIWARGYHAGRIAALKHGQYVLQKCIERDLDDDDDAASAA